MAEQECRCVGLLPDGTLVLEIGGQAREAALRGVQPPQPLPPAWQEWLLRRLPKTQRPLRCQIRSEATAPGERPSVTVQYFAWADKSGDVWEDLGARLVEEGLARVAPGVFPERSEYEQRQHRAQAAHRGLWAL
jgi:hypothetical protein